MKRSDAYPQTRRLRVAITTKLLDPEAIEEIEEIEEKPKPKPASKRPVAKK